jgi:hypothetical protein
MEKFSGFSLRYEWFVARLYMNDNYYGPAPTTRCMLINLHLSQKRSHARNRRATAAGGHFFRKKIGSKSEFKRTFMHVVKAEDV